MYALLIRTSPGQAAGLNPGTKFWLPCVQMTGSAPNWNKSMFRAMSLDQLIETDCRVINLSNLQNL